MSDERIVFEYWSDPLCVWAFVAQDKLDRILAEVGGSLEVRYHIVPVFGSIPWRFREGPWADKGIAGRVEATARVAREHGHPEVTGRCWAEDCPASSWGPGAAAKAVFALEEAEDVKAGTGAEYLGRMRERFFVDGRNVARREVQLELAEQLSIAPDALAARLDDGSALALLWEDERRKQELKIQGSPTYVFDGGRAKLYGNFSFGILQATVQELVSGLEPGASGC